MSILNIFQNRIKTIRVFVNMDELNADKSALADLRIELMHLVKTYYGFDVVVELVDKSSDKDHYYAETDGLDEINCDLLYYHAKSISDFLGNYIYENY